jgi:hypothetical protein
MSKEGLGPEARASNEGIRGGTVVETQTAPDKRGKRRTTIALLLACLVVGLAILCQSLWVGYSQDKATRELRETERDIHDQLWYARLLHMQAAVGSDIDVAAYSIDIWDNPGAYTCVEFVMEYPPLDKREPGVLYFAPNYEGDIHKLVYRLNELIASDPSLAAGEGLEYPLTLEDVVGNYERVQAVFNRMSAEQLAYFYGTLGELSSASGTPEAPAAPQSEEG